MKVWSYLANIKSQTSISGLTQNPITFECVEINDVVFESRFKNLTLGYINLMNEGFFDSFTNNYNILFVSKYDPTQNPINREKIFEMILYKLYKKPKKLKNT